MTILSLWRVFSLFEHMFLLFHAAYMLFGVVSRAAVLVGRPGSRNESQTAIQSRYRATAGICNRPALETLRQKLATLLCRHQ